MTNTTQFDPGTYAKEKGYSKYYQKHGTWWGNVDGKWQGFGSKKEARSANLGISTPKPTLESIQEGITEVAEGAAAIQEQIPGITPIASTVSTKDLDVTGETPNVGTPQAPSNLSAYTTGLLQDLDNKRTALDNMYNQQITDLRKQKTDLETKISDITATQKDILTKNIEPLLAPFREDLEKSERERLKIEENFFANQKSIQELETLLTQAQAEIAEAEGVTGLSAIRSPRIAKLQEDMAARVGVIEAVMAARNNQIIVAENLIDRSISAIEADRQDQLTYYEALYNFYETQRDEEGEKLVQLSKDEKDFLIAQIGLLESDLETSQVAVDYIKGLLLDPKTAELAETAGILLTDSIEVVNTKLANAIYEQDRRDKINKFEIDGYEFLALPGQLEGKPEEELVRIIDNRGNEMVFWKEEEEELLSVAEAKSLGVPYGTTKAEAKGVVPGAGAGGAVFADDFGNEYDLGTVEGLNQYKASNPSVTYEDMNAFLDANAKGLDAATRTKLLDASDFETSKEKEKTERFYDMSFYKKEIRERLKEDYNRTSPTGTSAEDFLDEMMLKYSQLTLADGKMLIELYIAEKNVVSELGYLSRKAYFWKKL